MQWGCCKIEFLKTYLIFSGGNHEQTVISTTILAFGERKCRENEFCNTPFVLHRVRGYLAVGVLTNWVRVSFVR